MKESLKKGSLEVISGCMFSGKTDELIRRVERYQYAKKSFLVIKPAVDTRYNKNDIVAHHGRSIKAVLLERGKETIESLREIAGEELTKTELIAFDEGNFFSEKLVKLCLDLINQGKRVIVAGLELNFRGEPFWPMPKLLAYADEVTKLTAVCMKCGEEATRTQRLTENGKPAPKNSPLIVVGGKNIYEARCKDCHEVPDE